MCQRTITPAPAPGQHPFQRAYDVAQIVADARHVAATIAEAVPETLHGINVDDLGRLGCLASAAARLMRVAEEAADALASDLQDLYISLTQGV
jgi:hypothetical protein